MVLNDALPAISVDPETYEVRADGELLRAASPRRCCAGAAILSVLSCSAGEAHDHCRPATICDTAT